MSSKIIDKLARQARLPTRGMWGWLVFHFLKYRHVGLEKNAARLCAIEPHHKILEIGFGPGTGVKHALQYVKDGPGKICGVDLSAYMVEKASARLRRPIQEGKVELGLGSVMDLPYSNDTFHRVFHCNCYYFWPSMQDSLREIYRVMRPGGMMVTTINMNWLKKIQAMGLLKYGHPDPVKYMRALELTGFDDVRIEYFKDGSLDYQGIFASLPVKVSTATADFDQDKGVYVSQEDSSHPHHKGQK